MRYLLLSLTCLLCLISNSSAEEKKIKHQMIKGEAVEALFNSTFGTGYSLRLYCGTGEGGMVIDLSEKLDGNRYQNSQIYYYLDESGLKEVNSREYLKSHTWIKEYLYSSGLPLFNSPLSLSKSAVSLSVGEDSYTAFIFEQNEGGKKISVLIWDTNRKQLLGNMHDIGDQLSIIGLEKNALPNPETLNKAIQRIYLVSNYLANNITEADLK